MTFSYPNLSVVSKLYRDIVTQFQIFVSIATTIQIQEGRYAASYDVYRARRGLCQLKWLQQFKN
jgi:hypothetical protein